ncbi:alpha-1,4-glucan--maltose-1-phosphate maltosyltransferase [Pigmentiphaga sp.]|uniref:alpha-1,4-glucan--maltose-1-phosphate maltosyltransferase n=1 Tax=Pigmentiphaga sp. TaxID=1977564 RepID=UPI00128E6D47|nr:alpha-1,4-glucan--maltose-1-phosphate maltosyltransferase [Pigmentiphaga sp.]MPS25650.1 alpha-1,4-glucan--maltose-1-phosphate maltosyltransferase [Alcaligenaceae bacterium SAGV5]MPS54281.1 alpha-1,4-glucan--maltose-1-phosphate maltosyltransferase [Alcaligenaceae bacterium SAGV3]MPT60176.1 alpha-1,4-glucan--maltose-1-phosphate maltosyltransferase [Alcaligenaceae bacterium]
MAARHRPLRVYHAGAAALGPVLDGAGALAAPWRGWLETAAALGFGQVLADVRDAGEEAACAALASAAARRRLDVYLDCPPVPAAGGAGAIDWSACAPAWRERGVRGLLIRGLPQGDPGLLRERLAALRRCDDGLDLLAWTPGLSREALRGLRGMGFSHVFSSLAWWNFRSAWFMDEWHALVDSGCAVLGFPADPYGPGAAGVGVPDAEVRRRASIRALWAAATCGAGWLVPMGYERHGLDGAPHGQLDLSEDVRAANRWLARAPADDVALSPLAGADAPVAMMLRRAVGPRGRRSHLLLFNPDLLAAAAVDWPMIQSRLPDRVQRPVDGGLPATLGPGAAEVVELGPAPPVLAGPPRRRSLTAAMGAARVAIEAVEPAIEQGRFAVKRTPGEALTVSADIFMDGHDKLAADLLWRAADEQDWTRVPMAHLGNDRWEAVCRPDRVGMGHCAIEAWRDTYATFLDELRKKTDAGVDVAVEVEEVRDWMLKVLGRASQAGREMRARAEEAARGVADLSTDACLAWIRSQEAAALVQALEPREFASRSAEYPVRVERRTARFGSWYECFPRSQSGDAHRHGTFADVAARLPAIRDMGFDVLYFPPIHPIGHRNRKGRNNSLVAEPGDPGSPYAIGSEEGGHDAVHPELGTLDDFRALVGEAARHGLEIALDFAIQCSPDHPWLARHPDWFAWRADGSLRHAENPPKKYEDIVNVDFYARTTGGRAASGLWLALLDVVMFWAAEGVRVFRVDNPHTKPLPFWEWLIGQVHARHPDVVFLSEAFTRPKMMYRLAKLGFSQSYTYFTWRETRRELTDYLEEISRPPVSDFFRPNFFVNTPDINPRHLHASGRPGFLIRAALAATLSGSWGMYSGFELCEGTPMPGKEEYLDSEKYEIRARDWGRPGNIVAEIGALNRIRRDNPALHLHTGTGFLNTDNDRVLAYTRATPERDNVVLVVVNLDPHGTQGANVELPLWAFGLPDDGTLHAEDLLRGYRFDWRGKMQHVRLEPGGPYAIWRISRRS